MNLNWIEVTKAFDVAHTDSVCPHCAYRTIDRSRNEKNKRIWDYKCNDCSFVLTLPESDHYPAVDRKRETPWLYKCVHSPSELERWLKLHKAVMSPGDRRWISGGGIWSPVHVMMAVHHSCGRYRISLIDLKSGLQFADDYIVASTKSTISAVKISKPIISDMIHGRIASANRAKEIKITERR